MSEKNTEQFNTSNALVVISNEYTSTPIGLTKSASSSASNDLQDDAPRIICNELIVNPHKSKSLEKLDELSSLEREIAKMHHVDEGQLDLDEAILSSSITSVGPGENQINQLHLATTLTTAAGESDLSNGKNGGKVAESHMEDKLDAITSGETALEHEDLIAVLKGLDGNADDTHNNSAITEDDSLILEEGVTIEGEGEYQIMEVIDDDSNANEDATKPDTTGSTGAATSSVRSMNKTKPYGTPALTLQEERALALEQMEGLKTVHRRRKQDIKPIKQIDASLDLVSALEAEWSENDDELSGETTKTDSSTKLPTLKSKASIAPTTSKTVADNKANTPLITSVVVIPSTTATVSSAPPTPTAAAATPPSTNTTKASTGSNNNVTTTENIKSSKSSPVDVIINTKTEEDTHIVTSQTAGFRRTRIIKRKIIWDPDAPETTFSYAKLVKPNNTKTKTEPTVKSPVTKGSTTITPLKKETTTNTPASTTAATTTKKTQRPTTPKVKKSATNLNTEKATLSTETPGATKTTVEKELVIKTNTKTDEADIKESPNLEAKAEPSPITSPAKRRSHTPVSNISPGGSAGVKKRKNNELERLMGDEGAVNMLNSLEKLEASLGPGETKSTRPMMRSRAATICEKLPRKDTTPPARRAPSPTSTDQPTTAKGKRGTKPRASASWDYVYKKKKQDFDDSLIIRRRSNSSYSSTTSLNRLSLDGPPASNSSTKSNDSKSLNNSSSENDLSKTPPATASHNKSSGSSKTPRSTPTPPASGGKSSFEFAKPENKKSTQKRTKSPAATLTNDMKKAAPVASRRNARSPATTASDDKGKEAAKTANTKSPTSTKKDMLSSSSPSSSSTISDVVVKKASKVAQIIFSTNKAKLNNTFTIQMLNKLVDILDKLASDPDCHVVVIGTNDTHFCQGIDLTDLITIAPEKRKNYAVNLATSVKNYLKTLATYPKPLIAGVSGNLMNLGVIQLALFDVVIAADKTTFETPYAKMGQAPEGYCIWHNMNKIRGSFKTKLFWLCEKIQSTEAALAGLVNKLTAANKVNEDSFATARRIASFSPETYRVMKKTAINSHLDVIVSSLDEEFDTIIKQWTSSDCLESLKKFLGHD